MYLKKKKNGKYYKSYNYYLLKMYKGNNYYTAKQKIIKEYVTKQGLDRAYYRLRRQGWKLFDMVEL